MKIVIKKIATIEDKEIFSIDSLIPVMDEDILRHHPEIKKILSDRYHYFEKETDPRFPNRWILYICPQSDLNPAIAWSNGTSEFKPLLRP